MTNRQGSVGGFLRHYLEMVLSMAVGMAVFGILFISPLDPLGYRESLRAHPYLSEFLMLIFMTASMVGFMIYRGHGVRMAAEMTAGMVVPVLLVMAGTSSAILPFLTERSLGLWTHVAMLLGMLAVMLVRRAHYDGSHGRPEADHRHI